MINVFVGNETGIDSPTGSPRVSHRYKNVYHVYVFLYDVEYCQMMYL